MDTLEMNINNEREPYWEYMGRRLREENESMTLNKAQRRAAMFEPGAGKERFDKTFKKDYGTRILDRITKSQEANIDTSRKGLIDKSRR